MRALLIVLGVIFGFWPAVVKDCSGDESTASSSGVGGGASSSTGGGGEGGAGVGGATTTTTATATTGAGGQGGEGGAPASCNDGKVNQAETDVDCGGGTCPRCELGQKCSTGGDCNSGKCTEGTCTPATCDDGDQNGDETGIDCGGPACGKCPDAQGCASNVDCFSNACVSGKCICPIDHLIISEVRTHGAGGPGDGQGFVELWNPTDKVIDLSGFTLYRAAASPMGAGYYGDEVGIGKTLLPFHHYLMVEKNWVGDYDAKIGDLPAAGGLKLLSDEVNMIVSSICYYTTAGENIWLGQDHGPSMSFTCEGTHVFMPGGADMSLERRPGGGAGNCHFAGDNAADFAPMSPSTPASSSDPAIF